jgi:hypothetical protein
MDKKIRINEFFMDNAWKWKCGLSEIDYDKRDKIDSGSIKSIEDLINLSIPDFLQKTTEIVNKLADHRMMQGTFRYGSKTRENIGKYDYKEFLQRRLTLYKETNNMEYLVDLFNGIRLEWLEAENKSYHFQSIDDGEHAQEIIK